MPNTWPVAHLTPDEIEMAAGVGRQRGDRHPKQAIGELALSVAILRKWDNGFETERWKVDRKLPHPLISLEVQLVASMGTEAVITETGEHGHAVVVGIDRDAPTFRFPGWGFAEDYRLSRYWSDERKCFLVPHQDLRNVWELRRPRRKSGARRIHDGDPADDYAGEGRFPRQLDTDDGGDPARYGRLVRSTFRLACRRCQRMIETTELSTWSVRTGTIHGVLTECLEKDGAGETKTSGRKRTA